jgi:transposase-like protein
MVSATGNEGLGRWMTRLLTGREVAAVLGVSTETVLRWARRARTCLDSACRPASFGFV